MDHEVGRQDAGLLSLRDFVDLELEAAAFGPPRVHAQQHLGEVLRVGAAVLRRDGAHGVALVVLTGEERPQLELVERRREAADRLRDLRLLAVVALLAGELVQHLRVLEAAREPVERAEVVAQRGVLGVHGLRPFLVVPEIGLADLDLELGDAGPGRVDLQVRLGLVEPLAERAEVVGVVTHRELPISDRGRA